MAWGVARVKKNVSLRFKRKFHSLTPAKAEGSHLQKTAALKQGISREAWNAATARAELSQERGLRRQGMQLRRQDMQLRQEAEAQAALWKQDAYASHSFYATWRSLGLLLLWFEQECWAASCCLAGIYVRTLHVCRGLLQQVYGLEWSWGRQGVQALFPRTWSELYKGSGSAPNSQPGDLLTGTC